MAKFLTTLFLVFTEHLPPTASEICTVPLFLESFFVSLDKSALFHHRCLMSKFTEMFMLACRKIFSAFYPALHESFSNSHGFALLQEFNIFYPHLLLYHRKHFCSILTDLSNLLFLFHKIKQWMWRMFLPVSKNAEAAVCKCSSEAAAQRCFVKKLFLEISQNSQESTCSRASLLLNLQAKVGTFN